MKLIYDSDDFPTNARKAISDGETFSFEVHGLAWRDLRPHVAEKSVLHWAGLVANPALRNFAGVMALAGAHAMPVRVELHDTFAEVLVGTTH